MNVYFISGLGADGRIFRNIQLPQGCKAVHLRWLQPAPNESLPSYALRLSEQVDTSQPFALVGLSMGGMMAVEIAKAFPPTALVLLSSIPTFRGLPPYYRWGGALRLHKVLPVGFFRAASVLKRYFTTETANEKSMLREMISAADSRFIKWGMGAILSWRNNELPAPMVHIHGSGDLILPQRFTKPTHVIPKGGHLMVLTHAPEINTLLHRVLSEASAPQAARMLTDEPAPGISAL